MTWEKNPEMQEGYRHERRDRIPRGMEAEEN